MVKFNRLVRLINLNNKQLDLKPYIVSISDHNTNLIDYFVLCFVAKCKC